MDIVTSPPALRNSQPQTPQDDLELSGRVWEELPRRGTILLGTGNLTLALAHVIVGSPPETRGLTIVTNSLDAAIVLSRASRLEVYNIGAEPCRQSLGHRRAIGPCARWSGYM